MQRSSAPDQPLSSESDEALPGGRVAPGNAVRRHRSARQQRPASMRDHHAATLPTTTPRISHESGKLTLDFVDHPGINAFSWEQEFPSVMADGGFDVVIGNPPYVFTREQFTSAERAYYSTRFPCGWEKRN